MGRSRLIDVLYLLAEVQQRRLLTDALTIIAPGGVLLVKEMAPAWKARWDTIQEALAVKLLRITEGGSFTFPPPQPLGGWLRAQGATVQQRRLDTGRIHPHRLIVATVPAVQPPPPG